MNDKILIDTNVLIWSIFGVGLSEKNLSILENAQEVFVSSISILEVRIKQDLGGLPAFDIIDNIQWMKFNLLPFSSAQAESYRLHARNNKDPFDNSLVSTAVAEKLQFMTSDKLILGLGIKGLVTINASK